MPRILYFLLMVLCGIQLPICAQQATVQFSAADAKADLQYLYTTLESAHFNLYAYTPKARFDSAFTSLQQKMGSDSLPLLEVHKYFQRFTALGGVGHCEIDFPAQAYIAYAMEGGTLFPLELAFEEGRAYIRKNFTGNPQLAEGTELISIEGELIAAVQAKIHPYLSAERPYFKDAKLEFWSLPRLYWQVYGAKNSFTVGFKNSAGTLQNQEVAAVTVIDYETQRKGEILNTSRFLQYYDEVAYLNPGPFSSTGPDDTEAAFRQFVDSAFADIKSRHASKLVIDLRNNAGGHNAYSDYLIAYFADKPFRWYSKFQLKTSAVLKAHTRQHTPDSLMDDYSRAILAHPDGAIFEFPWPVQEPVAKEKRFSGKVYVLVNRQTYSMAAVSAALLQDYGFATLVGEETGDVPTLYASQFSFTLPKTGIVVKVPKGYIIRPSGDEKLAGVVPDRLVRDHLLDAEDEILTDLLDYLQAQGN